MPAKPKPHVTMSTTRPPGTIDLDRWPLLVHAPKQWGDFVATEDSGVPVEKIALAAEEDRGASAEVLAKALGTTADHVRQALDYVGRSR